MCEYNFKNSKKKSNVNKMPNLQEGPFGGGLQEIDTKTLNNKLTLNTK